MSYIVVMLTSAALWHLIMSLSNHYFIGAMVVSVCGETSDLLQMATDHYALNVQVFHCVKRAPHYGHGMRVLLDHVDELSEGSHVDELALPHQL
jgi:hypothetical protein